MVLLLIGLFEWDNLTTKSNTRFVVTAMAVLTVAVAAYLLTYVFVSELAVYVLPAIILAGTIFWLLQVHVLTKGIDYERSKALEFAYGGLAILCVWSALVWLRHQPSNGHTMVLIAMMVVWAADIFAYFSGRGFGKHKLAPSISPGKTIEGVIGGMVGAGLVAWLGARYVIGIADHQMMAWLIAAMVAALISVAGDLYISRLKRQVGAKDTGNILPGHGGILDRIDGLIAAMPVFASLWWLLR